MEKLRNNCQKRTMWQQWFQNSWFSETVYNFGVQYFKRCRLSYTRWTQRQWNIFDLQSFYILVSLASKRSFHGLPDAPATKIDSVITCKYDYKTMPKILHQNLVDASANHHRPYQRKNEC